MCAIPPLSVAQARDLRCCRLCGLPISYAPIPAMLEQEDEFYWPLPVPVAASNGREYAHLACVRSAKA